MTSTNVANKSPGDIITFYSYKGGSGRSMALSNVACILKELPLKKRGVLMIDWDLEAPGLHKFFENDHYSENTYITDSFEIPDLRPGLIDLFIILHKAIRTSSIDEPYTQASYVLDQVSLDEFIIPTQYAKLFMIKAGRFDERYSANVNSFSWEKLHSQSPLLIRYLQTPVGRTF